jgi:micrococcal nuclease
MRNIRFFVSLSFFVTLLALAPRLSFAQETAAPAGTPEGMQIIANGTITEVLKSDMIMLDNNRRFRLDNILVPPYEELEAVDALKKAFLNEAVTLYSYHDENTAFDRYGLPLAHVVTEKGVWVQKDLVSKGLAWAFSSKGSEKMVDLLKQLEEKARAEQKGFWKNPAYAIKSPENIGDYKNSYQILEGKIVSVSVNPRFIYFNFSKEWKTGLAARVASPEFDSWFYTPGEETRVPEASPEYWKGRVVRIRGWVSDDKKRPLFELTHKAQVDLVPQKEDDKKHGGKK